jgi:hypothetical protein
MAPTDDLELAVAPHRQAGMRVAVQVTVRGPVIAAVEPGAPNPWPSGSTRLAPFTEANGNSRLERLLQHLYLLRHLRGSGPQRRGRCPVRSHPADQERTFSVHLGKNAFRCFQKNCGVQGNALDLGAAIHRLPQYDAALHLAETFGLPRNREEEPIKGTP